MPSCDLKSPFAIKYAEIQRAAMEYRIVDYQNKPEVNHVLDLNKLEDIQRLGSVLRDFRPQVVLCMEVLEHLNHPGLVMDAIADYLGEGQDAELFITVPNNSNWVFNLLGWNVDHTFAFFRDIAWRFVTRSRLGKYDVKMYGCMQRYLWYWWLVYVLSFFQPMNWGFRVRPRQA
jgi:hypothetical protein